MKSKHCPIFFLAVIIAFNAFGQNTSQIDSLKVVIEKAENDSVKVQALLSLTNSVMDGDTKSAELYVDQARAIATENNFDWGVARAYFVMGRISYSQGDFLRVLEYTNRSLKINLVRNDSLGICRDYNNIGEAYLELGKLEEAYFYISKSLEIAKKNIKTKSGKQKDRALLIAAIASHNLGVFFNEAGKMDSSLKYFLESENYSKMCNDADGPAYNAHEMGNAFLKHQDFENAKKNLQFSLSETNRLGLSNLKSSVFQSLGKLNFKIKRYEEAILYYDSAIAHFNRNGNRFGQAESNLGKSQVLIEQNKLKEANEITLASLNTAHSLNAKILELECHLTLSRLAEVKGDFKSALQFDRLAGQSRDSLTNVNVLSQVFENELLLRSQKKDEEIASLTKLQQESANDLKKQEFLRNIFAVVFALTMVLLYSVYRGGKRKVAMSDLLLKHQVEIEKRTIELEELNKVKDKFFSIISHDLRSPINSLSGLLDLMERNELKAEELPSLTKEMRVQFNHTKNLINNLLDWTLVQMNKVSIKKEKINLKSLIEENIRLLSSMSAKQTNFFEDVDDSITVMADQNMINLVFRNLILNGIKFTSQGGTIKISATKGEKEITVSVADNGVGIAQDVQQELFNKAAGYSTRGTANEKGTGLGLILAKEFIERNGGKIWLESEEKKGTTFFITIPVE